MVQICRNSKYYSQVSAINVNFFIYMFTKVHGLHNSKVFFTRLWVSTDVSEKLDLHSFWKMQDSTCTIPLLLIFTVSSF